MSSRYRQYLVEKYFSEKDMVALKKYVQTNGGTMILKAGTFPSIKMMFTDGEERTLVLTKGNQKYKVRYANKNLSFDDFSSAFKFIEEET